MKPLTLHEEIKEMANVEAFLMTLSEEDAMEARYEYKEGVSLKTLKKYYKPQK